MREMEHEEAIETMAAERYALGELDKMDREAFEEHFFDCPVCAESVQTGMSMMDGGRAHVRSHSSSNVKPFPRPARAPAWLSAAAAFAAFGIIGYQNLVTMPALVAERDAARTPQVMTPAYHEGAVRAEAGKPTEVSAPRGGFGLLQFDITPQSPAPQQYVAEVRDARGRSIFSVPVSIEQANETVNLLLPAGTWPSGQYQLVVHAVRDGSRRGEVVSFPFVVRVQ